ncbi:MAG TPA: VOC family protein [Pyrinomonadaceae bacterium]|nr:VOC family protein [Pyrinomonadaceae bacterium]
MSRVNSLKKRAAGAGTSPAYISHYGIRARQYGKMVRWYKKVFRARVQHENEFLAFMTFDEEHHRLVIFEDPETVDRPATAAGIDHIGYGVAGFGDFVETYERLKAAGIRPFAQLNHRFTTSLYYRDPDGNEVEFSVDNFPTKEECGAFVRGEGMAEIGRPPFGYDFDPDELARLYHEGAPAETLARIGLPREAKKGGRPPARRR